MRDAFCAHTAAGIAQSHRSALRFDAAIIAQANPKNLSKNRPKSKINSDELLELAKKSVEPLLFVLRRYPGPLAALNAANRAAFASTSMLAARTSAALVSSFLGYPLLSPFLDFSVAVGKN